MERELIKAVNDEQEQQGAGEQFQMSLAMRKGEIRTRWLMTSSESSEGSDFKRLSAFAPFFEKLISRATGSPFFCLRPFFVRESIEHHL